MVAIEPGDRGVSESTFCGTKADGTVFMTYQRSMLVPKRGHGVDDKMA